MAEKDEMMKVKNARESDAELTEDLIEEEDDRLDQVSGGDLEWSIEGDSDDQDTFDGSLPGQISILDDLELNHSKKKKGRLNR